MTTTNSEDHDLLISELFAEAHGLRMKYEEFSQGNIEDAVTKIVKLLANLSTEEEYANVQLDQSII